MAKRIERLGYLPLSDKDKERVKKIETTSDVLAVVGSAAFTFGTLGLLSTISVLLAIAVCGIEIGGLGFLLGYVLRRRYGTDID